mmetsp:Transcript_141724/g.440613  ORF Transcript_141724/g.440613 Transcript_141724/m.440613 type:complete len:292 (+) Transcript_141724:311-1186(+)
MDPGWFGEDYWLQLLTPAAGAEEAAEAPHVLHLTGITPQITPNAHKAWWKALKAARTLKERASRPGVTGAGPAPRIVVTMDLNHRPALGSWEDLWLMVEPHVGTLDLFVLSIGDLINVGELLHVEEAVAIKDAGVPEGIAGAAELDARLQRGLKAVQQRLGHRTAIAVTSKRREPQPPGAETPLQLRWSMVCLRSGEVISTLPSAVRQRPREEIGGGDSWLSGVIDGLVGLPGPAAAAPSWPAGTWRAALQRGDVLAALKQQVIGDFCHVEREQLEVAIVAHEVSGGHEVF